jgi:hypothetical protein
MLLGALESSKNGVNYLVSNSHEFGGGGFNIITTFPRTTPATPRTCVIAAYHHRHRHYGPPPLSASESTLARQCHALSESHSIISLLSGVSIARQREVNSIGAPDRRDRLPLIELQTTHHYLLTITEGSSWLAHVQSSSRTPSSLHHFPIVVVGYALS